MDAIGHLRMVDLAEGEELDSNILSQDFAPVRTTMVRGRKSQRKGDSPKRRSRESALGKYARIE
jgi:hypothetical protein